MLVIKSDQMRMFREHMIDRFEDDMVRAVATDFPPKFELLGEFEVRRLIRRAIETAPERRIVHQGALAVLIELMIQFGENFEFSPHRAWAETILTHPTLPDHVRVDLARQRMVEGMQGRTLVPWNAKPRTLTRSA